MVGTNQAIAENIRALAKARGITVKQTLADCGVNRNFLYDLEHSGSSPSIDKIARIAEYFGVPAAKLLGGEEGEIAALLSMYEKLSPEGKTAIRAYMEELLAAL